MASPEFPSDPAPFRDQLAQEYGPGFCVQEALIQAGYPEELAHQVPEWVQKSALQQILERLHIPAIWTDTSVSGDDSGILLYVTRDEQDGRPGTAHAQFVPRMEEFPFGERSIFGLIPKWRKRRDRSKRQRR